MLVHSRFCIPLVWIAGLAGIGAWSDGFATVPAPARSQELHVQSKAIEEAAPLEYASSVAIGLGLEHQALEVTCEHGDVLGDPGARGLARVGDRIEVGWRSVHVDRRIGDREDGKDRFARSWRTLELAVERRGAQLLEPLQARVVSPLVEEDVQFEWDESLSTFVAAGAKGSADPQLLSTTYGGLLLVDALDGLSFTESEATLIDPDAFWRSLWPGGFGRLGYGERGVETTTWPSVHIAIVPELPPRPEVWMESLEGDVRGRLAGSDSGAPSDVVRIELDLDLRGSVPVDRWLREILVEQGVPADYIDVLAYRGRGIGWRYVASGYVDWSEALGRITTASVAGKLKVSYQLEWSYSWDAPSFEEFHGELDESWEGDLRVDLACGAPASEEVGGKQSGDGR